MRVRTDRRDISLLLVDHLDAVASCKQLEFLHCDHFFAAEVPPDQVLKLTILKGETTPLDQAFELLDIHLLRVLMPDAVEKSL